MTRILIADDEPSMRRILAAVLQDDGAEVLEAASVTEALGILRRESLDAAVIDQRFPDGTGSEILSFARKLDTTLPIIVITAYATVELAVEMMREGAFDFINKPFHPETVKACLRRASERSHLARENQRLRAEILDRAAQELIGEAPAIFELRRKITQVAPTNATVLIRGETGTGKELLARAIHKASRRSGQPFVAVNCAALSETLLESELFGHEKGAFTGADRMREGMFEAAREGTLFLDEAGEMSAGLQAKLLRVLNDGIITRVGSNQGRKCDTRIIAATNVDLNAAIAEGRFREDLFYRLAVFPLEIPPLRERLDDLPLIADHLLIRIATDLAVPLRRLCPAALERLRSYDWPGNIRELRNVLERAAIVADGDVIEPDDLQLAPLRGGNENGDDPEAKGELLPLKEMLAQTEIRLIQRALRDADGVQAQAARLLGISRSDLLYKIRRHGIRVS